MDSKGVVQVDSRALCKPSITQLVTAFLASTVSRHHAQAYSSAAGVLHRLARRPRGSCTGTGWIKHCLNGQRPWTRWILCGMIVPACARLLSRKQPALSAFHPHPSPRQGLFPTALNSASTLSQAQQQQHGKIICGNLPLLLLTTSEMKSSTC